MIKEMVNSLSFVNITELKFGLSIFFIGKPSKSGLIRPPKISQTDQRYGRQRRFRISPRYETQSHDDFSYFGESEKLLLLREQDEKM